MGRGGRRSGAHLYNRGGGGGFFGAHLLQMVWGTFLVLTSTNVRGEGRLFGPGLVRQFCVQTGSS